MHNHLSSNLLDLFGTASERVDNAVRAIGQGKGVIVVDDEDRENEGDVIFAADCITPEQMNVMIRYGSGIVCLVLTDAQARYLELPPMVAQNESRFSTAFTVSIEAREGITTGVSAADRVTTIRAAVADGAGPRDIVRPGHVFPLRAHPGGLAARRGHTEATLDLVQRAGRRPAGVLCELMNEDGTMSRLPQLVAFALQHQMPIVSIEDLINSQRLQESA